MRKTILSLAIFSAALALPKVALADTVCTQEYGQAVVCTEQGQVQGTTHQPVATGLGEDIAALGTGLVAASLILFTLSKKAKKASLLVK